MQNPGQQSDLKRHLVCLDRKTGEMRWTKEVKVELPESQYQADNESKHGYAASTPASDGERIYVFFGKSGVHCFDLKGNEVWMKSVGTGTHRWGCATSPLLYKNLVIVNASSESGAILALDKFTGKEEWKINGIKETWSSPALVNLLDGKTEMVMNLPGRPAGKVAGYDLANGKELWYCAGVPDSYICPSPISPAGIVYVIGGRQNTAVAVKAGGRGEVEPLWTTKVGSNVASPVFHEGHIYWLHEEKNTAYCINAATGKQVYAEKIAGAGLT